MIMQPYLQANLDLWSLIVCNSLSTDDMIDAVDDINNENAAPYEQMCYRCFIVRSDASVASLLLLSTIIHISHIFLVMI